MRSTRSAGRLPGILSFGLAEFLTLNPPIILLTALLPRAVVQSLFFTILGRVLGGDAGARFAYVGGIALILSVLCSDVGEVPMADKWSGTFGRIRTGAPHPFVTVALRCWPYPVAATGMAMVSIVVVGLLTGHADLVLPLLSWLPAYFVMACTVSIATLAATLTALGRRADVLAANTMSFAILLAGGVFLPPGRVAVVDAIGSVLPIRHGLLAVRAGLAGEPWIAELALEIAVGLAWCAVSLAVMMIQVRRSRRNGTDDFT